MIQLPIEIGDTLLGGKFKNKRIVVKEIGLDEYGSPTVNGHSILKVRIPKLYKNLDENTVKSNINYIGYTTDSRGKITTYVEEITKDMNNEFKGVLIQLMYPTSYNNYSSGKQKSWFRVNNNMIHRKKDFTWEDGTIKLDVSNLGENTVKSKYKEAIEKFQKLPITVKVKKQDKRFCLFLQTVDGEECIDPVGYETKELAQHAALTKGYTVDGYEPPTNVTKKPVLERLIREIILELHANKPINELDVTDTETAKILDELGSLQEQLDNAEAEIAALKKKLNVAGLQKQIKTIIDEKLNVLMGEMEKSGERLARTENIIMKIERVSYAREDPQYKEGFLESLKKVNAATKKVLQDVLKAYTNTTYVAAKISFSKRQDENTLTEANIFTKFANWLTSMLGALVPKVSARGKQIDNELDKLERVLKIK